MKLLKAGSETHAPTLKVMSQQWASPVFVDSCSGNLLINNTAFKGPIFLVNRA